MLTATGIREGRNLDIQAPDARYWAEEAVQPGIATEDHIRDSEKVKSFPLIVMQYALRHLVRCTEFCLVCHCKVEGEFEALKPYVCSKPLCLYQYMNLGFGPSIEHDIVTQPYVVDLLISFCYTSAHARCLQYVPTGLALMVPAPAAMSEYGNIAGRQIPHGGRLALMPSSAQPVYADSVRPDAKLMGTAPSGPQVYKAKFDRQRMELLFPSTPTKIPLHVGSWISIIGSGLNDERLHCRVVETMLPSIRLGVPVICSAKKPTNKAESVAPFVPPQSRQFYATNRTDLTRTLTPATTPPLNAMSSVSSYCEVEFIIYDQNFDDLGHHEKWPTICMLLDTLPSVSELRDYLVDNGGHETSLRQWTDRISPAALGLLRWILASNRSCIVQVDNVESISHKSEERVSGMPGWMQFRFAQGAPDKEQRFIKSIQESTRDAKHPTLFAWHGSPLYNWHSIVREGLHFKLATHGISSPLNRLGMSSNLNSGRVYGDGVYHALDVQTSLNYSDQSNYSGRSAGDEYGKAIGHWPHSQLRISLALSLNEVVNAPTQFVSKQPHLVVAQLDWIQSRYLFVKCNMEGWQIRETMPTQVYEQDPGFLPLGSSRTPLVIPLNAVSKFRRPKSTGSVKNGSKKVKVDKQEDDLVVLSDDTDLEDLELFFSDVEESQPKFSRKKFDLPAIPAQLTATDSAQTEFRPGSLDPSTLMLLEPPSYATSMATKALQRELTATLKVQDNHPLHELGWYIDPSLILNVYQWIVELHSFEPQLPIAQEMKEKDIQSIIIEIRFGAQYPMSPPFVRVVRPRFLSFMQGGGGHVTAGGALCMELLTNSGWSAVSNIESVLLQVRLAISSTDPKPARLIPGPVSSYQVGEAVEAYIRACNAHGWEIPADFRSNYSGSTADGNHFTNSVPTLRD